MAHVALDGKLACQILLAFRVLPSGIPSPSFQLEKNFPTTGKKFPSDRQNFFCCPSVNHSNFRKLRTFWSNFRKSFSFRQEKFFLLAGKVLPSDIPSPSFRQKKFFHPTGHKRMSDVPPTESIPKPEEPTAPAPQQTY
ncbi:hypothetical protein TVAG_333470 [Trichomonas vaginalis G3]|uniref:Uncharacterized protein n=1 Tax=Trichomonas vaginalis (strain ATCC PRA-98 / G3) TaxID=412133 RepID=A2GKY3_TRIV3|nr:hypothetical protein TVAGG3_0193250 [Trichomonas vaginalis G3]EAX82185.1 hypothetical protein TVAG_333470 [Trichomonas vaginalis G3]KAI5550126.1 hypothetical protein TVAGG3_0193250 [Trichomonas vaginalis G3]|eukprot:XP_001295115.1 hypothetical protein [Trichomonas vaginalis G3]